ncbi:hypothetical protein B0F90DRAFT_1815577 [Multifurca ochricompacta]|uniref:Uncharacterized protein n=1 Tax=Multifurca ochricompacta TaxID=376703 RepID=A0AAD4M8D2_9AGAM|nr:hypothetical protein B0F90DRAFT_1815577 [Multifurca ochricompacta]
MSEGNPSQVLFNQVDEKAAPAPAVKPPSYQATSEALAFSSVGTEPDRPRCSPRRPRIRHFFVAAFFLWLAGHTLLRHCKHRRFHHDSGRHWATDTDFHLGVPSTEPGESIDTCVESADWTEVGPSDRYNSPRFEVWQRTELSLPTDADDIFLFSRGTYAHGVLHIVEAADRDDIGVEIVVGSHEDSDLFERSSVCTLHRGDNGHGVGIFTPKFNRHPRERDTLFFIITVSLPQESEVVVIPYFETRLPLFHHVVAALPTHTFTSISLHSSNFPIYAESLVGDKISIGTSNSPIEGNFNTSSSLDIKTSNTPIKVVVNAFNQNHSKPTEIRIRTSNSGGFVVSAQTSNSPLDVKFSDHAADATLKLDARTSNSPAKVHLHPSFEGTFKLRTSIFGVNVNPDVKVEDPAGRGRKRRVNVKTIGRGARIVHGDAAWVSEETIKIRRLLGKWMFPRAIPHCFYGFNLRIDEVFLPLSVHHDHFYSNNY